MALFKRRAPSGVLLGGARIAFFSDHKHPPRISSPLDWDARDPDGDDLVELISVDVSYGADVPRPRADVFLTLSYVTKIAYNLGRAAEDLIWTSLHPPNSGSYEDVGPVGWVELEVIKHEAAPGAPTRTFVVEHWLGEPWFVQTPYEGQRGRENYYAPMSVWALIRTVRAGLGSDAELLDRSLALLYWFWFQNPDVLAKTGPALYALPEALVDEALTSTD